MQNQDDPQDTPLSYVKENKSPIFIIVLICILALGFYIYSESTRSIPIAGGNHIEGIVGIPNIRNPILMPLREEGSEVIKLIYSSLMKYNSKGEIVNDLASQIEISEKKDVYSFTLKDNLVWSDGQPLTTNDVAFTIQAIKDEKYNSPFISLFEDIEVSQENENTISFRLPTSYSPFLEKMTIPIIPSHVWENKSVEEFESPNVTDYVGSNKFLLTEILENQENQTTSYKFRQNLNYHDQHPYIETVQLIFYNNFDQLMTAYNNKQIDAIGSLPSFIANDFIENNPSAVIHELKTPRYFAVFLNSQQQELFNDPNIRLAISLATNRQDIVEQALYGYGTVSYTPIPSIISEYHDKNSYPEQSIDKANDILSENGWIYETSSTIREKNGTSLTLEIIIPEAEELIRVANIIKQQWQEAGINLEITTTSLSIIKGQVIPARSYDMLLYGGALGFIPDLYQFWHSSQKTSGLNLSMVERQAVDIMLEQLRIDQNKNTYKKLQEYFKENIFAIFLYEPSLIYVTRNDINVKNPVLSDPSNRFLDIENWYMETKRSFSSV